MNKESIAEELRERNMNVNMAEDSYQLAQWHIDKQIELLDRMATLISEETVDVESIELIEEEIKDLKDAN